MLSLYNLVMILLVSTHVFNLHTYPWEFCLKVQFSLFVIHPCMHFSPSYELYSYITNIFILPFSLIITGKSIGGHQGFDIASYMKEISRLKLPNQQITISVQTMDQKSLVSENGIGLGLPSCRREGIIPVQKHIKKEVKSEFYQFIDADCVWSHLHPYDEENILKSKFNVNKKLSTQSLHVPIFIISVDTPDPTYLADLEQVFMYIYLCMYIYI
jgi:hypothetical protein